MKPIKTDKAPLFRLNSGAYYLIQNTTSGLISKLIIILIICSSCSTMKINGIDVSKKHQQKLSAKERRIMLLTGVAGFALGTHFHDKFKKK